MRTRLARPEDVSAISRLISQFVAQGLLLPRSPEEVRAHLNRFIVLTELVPALDGPPWATVSAPWARAAATRWRTMTGRESAETRGYLPS
jgi:hypothetical protein